MKIDIDSRIPYEPDKKGGTELADRYRSYYTSEGYQSTDFSISPDAFTLSESDREQIQNIHDIILELNTYIKLPELDFSSIFKFCVDEEGPKAVYNPLNGLLILSNNALPAEFAHEYLHSLSFHGRNKNSQFPMVACGLTSFVEGSSGNSVFHWLNEAIISQKTSNILAVHDGKETPEMGDFHESHAFYGRVIGLPLRIFCEKFGDFVKSELPISEVLIKGAKSDVLTRILNSSSSISSTELALHILSFGTFLDPSPVLRLIEKFSESRINGGFEKFVEVSLELDGLLEQEEDERKLEIIHSKFRDVFRGIMIKDALMISLSHQDTFFNLIN